MRLAAVGLHRRACREVDMEHATQHLQKRQGVLPWDGSHLERLFVATVGMGDQNQEEASYPASFWPQAWESAEHCPIWN